MSDNNADYNGSGQDEYFATNDSTQADYSSRRMATISLHHSRTIPTRTHRSSPCRICPGYAGQQHPRRTYGNGQPYGQSAAYGSSVPAYGSAAPAYGSDSAAQPAQPIYGQRRTDLRITHNRRRPPIIRSDSAPIHAVRIQSATNLRAADLLSGDQQQPGYGYAQKSKIVAGLLGLFLGTLGVHNFYLGYTGKAVAQLLLTLIGWIILIGPIISGIWALIEAVLILCSSYGSNWHRDGHGQELQD